MEQKDHDENGPVEHSDKQGLFWKFLLYRLPVELIVCILQFATLHTTAMHLAHITSHLRKIALEAPILWSTIHLTKLRQESSANTLHRLVFYITHSGAAPLDLCFIFEGYEVTTDHHTIAGHIIDLIRPHIERVRKLRFQDDHNIGERNMGVVMVSPLGRLDLQAPMLESLDLHSFDGHLIPETFLGNQCPRLRTLAIRGTVDQIDSPWFKALKEIRLHELCFDFSRWHSDTSSPDSRTTSRMVGKFESIIRTSTSSLVKLELRAIILHDQEGDWSDAAMTLDRLEEFYIEGCITFALPHIRAPSLKTFTIDANLESHHGIESDYLRTLTNTMDFLKRHANTLEWTTISICDFINVLPATFSANNFNGTPRRPTTFPLLRELSTMVGVGLAAIANSMVMPNLHELSIEMRDDIAIPWTTFGYILLGCPCLQKLSIEWTMMWNGEPTVLGDLEGFAKIGLPNLQELRLSNVPQAHLFTSRLENVCSLRCMVLDGEGNDDEVRIATTTTTSD